MIEGGARWGYDPIWKKRTINEKKQDPPTAV